MFTAIYSTSIALGNHLRASLQAVPGLGFGGGGARVVSVNSPREMREEADQEGLSVWLYRIERDDQRLNIPDERVAPNLVRRPPLPLRLHYLMTPVTFKGGSGSGGAPDIEQKVMGRVMQALHTRPILRGSDLDGTDFEGSPAQLIVRLESISLDETSRVWEALEGSFQLTVSYEVSVVNIDVLTEPALIAPVDVVLPEVAVLVGEPA